MKLKTAEIIIDEALYPRNQRDWMTVYRYAEAMQAGAAFPPPVVGKRHGSWVLIDGAHRVEAYRKLKHKEIQVIITKVKEGDFFLEAVRLNAANGRALSTQERIGAAARLKEQGFGEAEISAALFMPVSTLSRLLVERVVTKPTAKNLHGVVRKAAAVGGESPNGADQRSLQTQDAKSAFLQTIAIIEHKWFDGDDLEIQELLKRLQAAVAGIAKPAAA